MTRSGDPRALGQLLRSRRERLTPADVGLPAGTRRRAQGLRREEVAMLASLSTTYYTFLEQGRPVHPSAQVLEALACALRMSAAEHRYLRVLADGPDSVEAETDEAPPEQLAAGVVALVHRLDPDPTYVKGRRWDVLAANPAARELFTDWEAVPSGERNLVRWMFTMQRAREVYVDWESEARAMLGRFRMAAARHPGDPDFAALIEQLHQESDLVREWWPGHDVRAVGSGSKKLRHPRLGPVSYSHVVLQVADSPEQTMVTFTAEGGYGAPITRSRKVTSKPLPSGAAHMAPARTSAPGGRYTSAPRHGSRPSTA
jgi:transcriptional regulator with XRE-family HTH domain